MNERNTKQKKLIRNALNNLCGKHPTAEDIFAEVRKNDSTVSFATVYRNLNALSESGVIKKLDGLEVRAHYDQDIKDHHHFICDKCLTVIDIPAKLVSGNIKLNAEKHGDFKVSYSDITLHGICGNCLRKI